jgi:hypothetical protein
MISLRKRFRAATKRFALFYLTGLAGCAAPADDATPKGLIVTDSAGVEIVESSRPLLAGDAGWRVLDSAVVHIGRRDGPVALQLAGVEGALRLTDGRYVIADGGSAELRVFGADGDPQRSFGRPGAGPGEFTTLAGIGRSADAIWAYDFALRRVSWFHPDSGVVGTTTLGAEPAALAPAGALPDRSFVLRQLWGVTATAAATREGVRRDPVAVVRTDSTGSRMDTIALGPGREVTIRVEGGRGVMSRRPFGRDLASAVRDGRVVIGTEDTAAIEEYALDGTLRRRIRFRDGPRGIGEQEIDEFVAAALVDVPPPERTTRRAELEALPYPERGPSYDRLVVDDRGYLWIRRWKADPAAPRVWSVVDPSGAWLTEVELPAGFTLLDVSDDLVVGVELDELDTESVVAYPLLKR